MSHDFPSSSNHGLKISNFQTHYNSSYANDNKKKI